MAEYEVFTQEPRIQVSFAHPHSPGEQGTNENTNGLIRQFFPKGTDFIRVSRCQIKHVQTLLNARPHRCSTGGHRVRRFTTSLLR
jgi:transposase, IS30 family